MGAEETRENDAAHYGNNSIHCSSVKSGILNDAKAAPAVARSADLQETYVAVGTRLPTLEPLASLRVL
jgi:hypothetical protein